MKSITPLGRKWEWLHSLWLIPLLFISPYGYVVFIVFFYIGIRARRKKWIYSGIIYFIIEISFFFIYQEDTLRNVSNVWMDLTRRLFLLSYLTAWIQATWARKEYLEIISQKVINKNLEIRKEEVNEEKEVSQTKTLSNHSLDINTASKQDIALIMGPDIADRIVKGRKENGYFSSYIDIVRHVEIKPHELHSLKKHFILNQQYIDYNKNKGSIFGKRGGRKVDY